MMLRSLEIRSQQAGEVLAVAVTALPPSNPGSAAPGRRLVALRRGELAHVASVLGSDALAQRLVDQGLFPGVEVELVTTAPGGDPLLIVLHGYRLALRRDEADRVVLAAPGPPESSA